MGIALSIGLPRRAPFLARVAPTCLGRRIVQNLFGALPLVAAVATAALVTTPGHGGPSHSPAIASRVVGVSPERLGRSVGSPTDGHLVGGAHLDETTELRICPAYEAGDVRWALESLVALLNKASREVAKKFPGSVLNVGHLSRSGGGEIDRHASHETGRDADVGFFARTTPGKSLLLDQFVAFRPDGTSAEMPGARFDDARNWAVVASLVSETRAHVTHIFVAAPLRARLLAYAEKNGAPASLRLHAAQLMAQPHGSLPHDDHFHVRIACPAHMSECIENPLPRSAHGHKRGATNGQARRPPNTAPPHTKGRGPAHAPPHGKSAPQHHAVLPPTHDEPDGHLFPETSAPAVLATPVDDADGPLAD